MKSRKSMQQIESLIRWHAADWPLDWTMISMATASFSSYFSLPVSLLAYKPTNPSLAL